METSTEKSSLYRHLEKMPLIDILTNINKEDQKVARAVKKAIPQIEALVNACFSKLKDGGRLFYIGAGTSGRLGIIDASECPPTFGVPFDLIIGIIAGGDSAIRKAVEFAEDDFEQAWIDLKTYNINKNDFVIGIAASGRTPYVIGGLKNCRDNGIFTGSITCNKSSEVSKQADFPIEVIVGPEFITGSTRMKAGTAQKLVLNMISTSLMVLSGKVEDNKMVDMQLSNNKLIERGTKIIMERGKLPYNKAKELLLTKGTVRKALKELGV